MNKIERFEDIIAWQKARVLTKEIYACTKNPPFAKDFGLKDQIRRAAISVTSNIAEGFERGGNKEFIQFLSNAKGSCGEIRDPLYVAIDEGYISQRDFDALYQLSLGVSRLISRFMTYLRRTAIRGQKFRTGTELT